MTLLPLRSKGQAEAAELLRGAGTLRSSGNSGTGRQRAHLEPVQPQQPRGLWQDRVSPPKAGGNPRSGQQQQPPMEMCWLQSAELGLSDFTAFWGLSCSIPSVGWAGVAVSGSVWVWSREDWEQECDEPNFSVR